MYVDHLALGACFRSMEAVAMPKMVPLQRRSRLLLKEFGGREDAQDGAHCSDMDYWLLVSASEAWRPWRCPRWRPLLGHSCESPGFWCLLEKHGGHGDTQDGAHYLDMIVTLPGLWCLLEKHGGRGDAQDGAHYLDMVVTLPGLWCLLEKHGGRGDAQDSAHYLDIIVNDLAFCVCLRSMEAVAMPKMAPNLT